MTESVTQNKIKTDHVASLPDAIEVAARTQKNKKDDVDAGDIKQDEFKYKRGYAPRAVENRATWSVAEFDTWLEKKHWTDTATGRAAIEFISRITLGGMFFAWMSGSDSMKRMAQYDPSTHQKKVADGSAKWLEKAAYFSDQTVGKILHKGLSAYHGGDTRKADLALRFRNTRPEMPGVNLPGRSLGAELTMVTGDFAAMSVGSGIARELLLNTLNPRERKTWLNEDGKFDPLHVVKRLAGKAWDILTYNAGEDVAVALPYVFFLRGCRNFIDKNLAPGFRYGSDSGIDAGGSLVVGDHGNVKKELQRAGAIDLQARFVTYNVFTQIYRDAYGAVGNALVKWKNNGFKLQVPELLKNPENIPEAVIDRTKGTIRYLAISSIRSILQMMPSVPFFSFFRVPNSKPFGFAVHPDHGVVEGLIQRAGDAEPKWHRLRRGDADLTADMKLRFSNVPESETFPVAGNKYFTKNPFFTNDGTEKYHHFHGADQGKGLYHSAMSRFTDKIGRTTDAFASSPLWEKGQRWFWKLTGNGDRSAELSRNAMLAGVPYASYFSAKVYFRESYVNDQMNLSIGRMLDGIVKWNRDDFTEGLNEIQRTMLGLPFRQTSRKAELIMNHVAHPFDKSPMPERWTKENHLEYAEKVNKGAQPDPYELMEQLSTQRANFYKERSRVYHEARKKNEDILQKPKNSSWEQGVAEKEAQMDTFVVTGI